MADSRYSLASAQQPQGWESIWADLDALPEFWRMPEQAVVAWADVLWEAGGRQVLDLARITQKEEESMALKFPSDEWIKELSNQLNASEVYEKSAKDWEGDFIFIVEPDDAYDGTAYLFLALYHGKSPAAAALASEDERDVEFILRAPFSNWRKVIKGELDAIQGMMTRKLKVQGNLMKIMRYPTAAKNLVACCARVPTDWD